MPADAQNQTGAQQQSAGAQQSEAQTQYAQAHTLLAIAVEQAKTIFPGADTQLYYLQTAIDNAVAATVQAAAPTPQPQAPAPDITTALAQYHAAQDKQERLLRKQTKGEA